MADHVLAAPNKGLYEIDLPAETIVTVEVEPAGSEPVTDVEVLVHDADTPVYVRNGTAVDVQDPQAYLVPPGTSAAYVPATTIALICASDSRVSLIRR
ncbi:hypothetical protein EDF38_1295 [Frigoribacterium sp. PhB160]|uniref:hypothetical protein n=1 Tax=Frigoribacterium sp. PhB160 TaxID=2485192 RepID=UPI000F49D407|nr:hypothetical protein [Frigoribacterium sp. PhB160]ROS62192.1 hypothetical protein EDF38_1295 [Frigoribacterium sp. PhB160]